MKTLLLTFLMALPCHAQRKLWTWTSPIAGESFVTGALHDAATDDKGNAAFVIGELKSTDYPTTKEFCRYRLVWVSAKGKVLLDKTIDRPDDQIQHIVNAESPGRTWSIVTVSASSWAVTDGQTVWSATSKGGKVQVKTTEIPEEEFVFPANNKSTFAGWFRQKGPRGSFVYGGIRDSKEASYAVPFEISLWVP